MSTGKVSKVAAVTLSFWILKVITTTAGDLSGDLLSMTLGLGYALALIVSLAVTAALLSAQLKAKRFHPWLYWISILGTSAAGAEISDSLDRGLHWGNLAGTGLLLGALLLALVLWRMRRGAVKIASIEQRPDERYYWLAALAANSLGSALCDLIGEKLGVSVFGGTVVNLAVLALLLLLHYRTRTRKPWLFWTAFVFTRIPF